MSAKFLFYLFYESFYILTIYRYLSDISTDTFIVIDEYVRKVIHKSFIYHDDPGKNNTLAYEFINNLDLFNENLTSLVPYIKQDVSKNAVETVFSEKSASRRRSSAKKNTPLYSTLQSAENSTVYTEVFEMDNEILSKELPPNSEKSSSMQSEKTNSGWHVVSGRKSSFTNPVKPLFPSSSPIVGSPKVSSSPASVPHTAPVLLNESTFPKIGMWGSNSNRRLSNNTSFEKKPSILAAENVTPKVSSLANALEKVNVSNDSANGSSSNSSISDSLKSAPVALFQGETLSSIIETKAKKGGKLSQRERRKMQLDLEKQSREKPQAASDSPGTSNPWNVLSHPVIKKPNLDSPFSMYSKSVVKKSDAEIAASYKPTITDIMKQEQFEIEQKAIEKAKSLKEIQEEEQFAKWWAEESAKVQREQELLENLANGNSSSSGGYSKKKHHKQQQQSQNKNSSNSNAKRRTQKNQGLLANNDLFINSGIPLPLAEYKSNGSYHNYNINGSDSGNENYKRRSCQNSATRTSWKGKGRTTTRQT